MTPYEKFKSLHFKETPLLLGNVWNVQSAWVYEQLNFEAIGTSSAAVAHSLGYEDGQVLPFDEYLYIIKRIIKSVNIPLSVDLEAGFGNSVEKVLSNIIHLYELGVVGINIEDSFVKDSERTIKEAETFTAELKVLTHALKLLKITIFVNVRSDAYLLNLPNALEETKKRIKLYETAKVDGIFIPGITNEEDIGETVKTTNLPLNVMCFPHLPDFKTLKSLGVRRVSLGNFINGHIYNQIKSLSTNFVKDDSFKVLFNN